MTTATIFWHWQTEEIGDTHLPLELHGLSAAELEHIQTIRLPRRAQEWRSARLVVKHLLSVVFGWPDALYAQIEIYNRGGGAPAVRFSESEWPAFISLSHRNGAVGAALSRSVPLGFDLECVEPHSSAFCREYFTPAENAYLALLSNSEHAQMASAFWSGKEAVLKAIGTGLNLDTRRIELRPGGSLSADWSYWPATLYTPEYPSAWQIAVRLCDQTIISLAFPATAPVSLVEIEQAPCHASA
jgi:4'-phosphopantetheinyl transferase